VIPTGDGTNTSSGVIPSDAIIWPGGTRTVPLDLKQKAIDDAAAESARLQVTHAFSPQFHALYGFSQ
jgi:hypothetical protein